MKLSQTNGPILHFYDGDLHSSLVHLRNAGFKYIDISFWSRYLPGSPYFTTDNEVVDESTAADILLTAKALCDEAGISFYAVDLVLRYPPYDEISYERPKGSVRIDGFLAEDIYEEGMEERVRLAVEERKASYAGENEK